MLKAATPRSVMKTALTRSAWIPTRAECSFSSSKIHSASKIQHPAVALRIQQREHLLRVAESRRFDQQSVGSSSGEQGRQGDLHRDTSGTAHAPARHFADEYALLFGGLALDQAAVHSHFAELVDQDRPALGLRFLPQKVQDCGRLPDAQEARDHVGDHSAGFLRECASQFGHGVAPSACPMRRSGEVPLGAHEFRGNAGGERNFYRIRISGTSRRAGHQPAVVQLHTFLDRTGIAASVFCAIHCAIAPILLIAAPALGGVWTHPLSHLAIAALVLPVAGFALRSGLRSHGRRWVAVLGGLGIVLVLVGAVLPYLTTSADVGAACCDQCCPSLVVDEVTGAESLNVPPASIVTLLGGISLVVSHMANLRCCAGCRSAEPVLP